MTETAIDAAGDFAVIAPASRPVRFAGSALEILPLKVGQLPGVMRALQGIDLAQGLDTAVLPALIAEHGERIIEAAVIATRVPREEIENAELDEFAALLAALIEVNSDFFVQRVVPALTARTAAQS